MYSQQEARDRIQRRRNGYSKEVSSGGKNIVFLIIGIICIGYLVAGNEKVSGIVNTTVKYLQTNVPWSYLIPFENVFIEESEAVVSTTSGYIATDTYGYYTNDSNTAISLGDGLVVYIEDHKDKRFIVVSHENGVSVTYGNLLYTEVSLYDRVLKGDRLGVFSSSILLEAMKDNEDLDMEEVFPLFEN